MAKKIRSEEEAYKRYHELYQAGRQAFIDYGTDPITGKVADDANYMYYKLGKSEQRLGQIVESVEAFGRLQYSKALRKYEDKLEKWKPESGEPKPKKPHRDSFDRYLDQFARAQTRRYTTAQAQAIVDGKFKIEEEVFVLDRKTKEKIPLTDKETGELITDPDTGELLYKTRIRKRKVTKNDVYYRTEEDAEKFFWDPIRKRRQALIQQEKELGEKGRTGSELSVWLAETIANEFFGSEAPDER